MNGQLDKEVQKVVDGLGKERDFISKKIIALQKYISEQDPASNGLCNYYLRGLISKQIKALIDYLTELDELITECKGFSKEGANAIKGIVERL